MKQICKLLGFKKGDLKKRCEALNPIVIEALEAYAKDELQEVKLTQKDKKELLEKCEYLNKFCSDDDDELKQKFIEHLNGKITITESGIIVNSIEDMFKMSDIPASEALAEIFKKSKTDQLLTTADLEALTPLKLKEWLKDRKWTYKDLAEAIGAGESTLKAWISKGEIPEWAKRSVLYIQKCEEFEKKLFDCIEEHTTIKESLRDFKDLLDNI